MSIPSPMSLKRSFEVRTLGLEVGIYLGPGCRHDLPRYLFSMQRSEEHTNWNIRVFDSTRQLEGAIATWKPDVLITHWHGEYSKRRNVPLEVAKRLRRQRGQRLGEGPFLAGQISKGDVRFSSDSRDDGDMLTRLLKTFDMIFEEPEDYEALIENIAIGMINRWNWDSGFHGIREPFGPGFCGYVAHLDEDEAAAN